MQSRRPPTHREHTDTARLHRHAASANLKKEESDDMPNRGLLSASYDPLTQKSTHLRETGRLMEEKAARADTSVDSRRSKIINSDQTALIEAGLSQPAPPMASACSVYTERT